MRMFGMILLLVGFLVVASPEPAYAYVGPGAGLTIIGVAVAFVATLVLGVFGFVWYPLKRLIQAISGKKVAGSSATDA